MVVLITKQGIVWGEDRALVKGERRSYHLNDILAGLCRKHGINRLTEPGAFAKKRFRDL